MSTPRPSPRPVGPPHRFWRVAARTPLRALAAGDGDHPIVMFPGFAMRPEVYTATAAELVARGASVVAFDLFSAPGRWDAEAIEDGSAEILERLGAGPATMVAHSFGGAILLGLAAARPSLVRTAVFSDTLGLSCGLRLAEEALGLRALLRLASPPAVLSFARSVSEHPVTVAGAAWWGYRSHRSAQTDTVATSGIACHVLWAERDTLLPRSEGEAFARRLGASFHVIETSDGGPVDHDAMYRHPRRFVAALEAVGALA
ncbi:MAG TPA: alpha/beta hydrolase [Acidimicrobiales bacterium]|nr:alpha/beta hydrolase [Acidimicrobiales bacterium]